jgi:tmRNA-binding protein
MESEVSLAWSQEPDIEPYSQVKKKKSVWIASTVCEPFQKAINFELEIGDVVRLMLHRNEIVVLEL